MRNKFWALKSRFHIWFDIFILGPVRQAAAEFSDIYQYTGLPESYMIYFTDSSLQRNGIIGRSLFFALLCFYL